MPQAEAFPPYISRSASLNTPLSPTAPCDKESGGKSRRLGAAFSNLPQKKGEKIPPAPKRPLPYPQFPLHGCVSRQVHSASKLPAVSNPHLAPALLPPPPTCLPIAAKPPPQTKESNIPPHTTPLSCSQRSSSSAALAPAPPSPGPPPGARAPPPAGTPLVAGAIFFAA